MKLTDTACKNAKPADKPRKLSDGNGLCLEVMPNGKKYWRQKYRYLGKEKRLAHGVYPQTTLAEARDRRDKARKLLEELRQLCGNYEWVFPSQVRPRNHMSNIPYWKL